MDAVHLGGDDDPSQYAFDEPRQTDVAMVEHGGGVKRHLEYEHAKRGSPENGNNRKLNYHRQDDLNGMKAQPCRDIKLQVGVVHPMQPPKRWNSVEDDVLEIDRKIEQKNRE